MNYNNWAGVPGGQNDPENFDLLKVVRKNNKYSPNSGAMVIYLVVEPTRLNNMLVKLDHFPRDRGEKSNI